MSSTMNDETRNRLHEYLQPLVITPRERSLIQTVIELAYMAGLKNGREEHYRDLTNLANRVGRNENPMGSTDGR